MPTIDQEKVQVVPFSSVGAGVRLTPSSDHAIAVVPDGAVAVKTSVFGSVMITGAVGAATFGLES